MISPMVSDLIVRIERFCIQEGVSATKFGRLTAHDRHLVRRLKNGGTITLHTFEKIEIILGFARLKTADKDEFLNLHEAAINRWQARSAS